MKLTQRFRSLSQKRTDTLGLVDFFLNKIVHKKVRASKRKSLQVVSKSLVLNLNSENRQPTNIPKTQVDKK